MVTRRWMLSGLVLVGLAGSSVEAAVRFVKPSGGSTSGACATWATGCTLGYALTQAVSGDEMWCKEGTYTLTTTLTLKNGVKMYGGFAGTETLAKNSNPATRVTILDAGGTMPAVIGQDNAASTVLRGFTIKNGRSNEGGGILLENSSALIVQCIFEYNSAFDFGGAATVKGSGSPQFINTVFRNNGESGIFENLGGGALYVYRGSPQFVNCLFHHNKAQEGGAVLVAFGTPTFINTTFADNEASVTYGGGIADQNGNATLKNCIVWGNIAAKQSASDKQIYTGSGGSTLATYSNIDGGWVGVTNINANPLFNEPTSGNYSLQTSSPCLDTGENAALPPDAGNLDWDMDTDEITPKDLNGKSRTFLGSAVDMGPFETTTGMEE